MGPTRGNNEIKQRKPIIYITAIFAKKLCIGLLRFQGCPRWGCRTTILQVDAVGHQGVANHSNIVKVEHASKLLRAEAKESAAAISWYISLILNNV